MKNSYENRKSLDGSPKYPAQTGAKENFIFFLLDRLGPAKNLADVENGIILTFDEMMFYVETIK